MMATMQSRSVRRREDVRLLTGKGNYSAEPQPPECCTPCWFARTMRTRRSAASILGGARHAWRGCRVHRR